ncbi:hypothetical protein ABH939_003944 [Rhodococcus sp. 27YEA6]
MLFNKITALGGVVALCLSVGCSVTGDVPTDACEEGPSAPGTTNAPTGDLRGWTQVFVDNFDRCELGEMWGRTAANLGVILTVGGSLRKSVSPRGFCACVRSRMATSGSLAVFLTVQCRKLMGNGWFVCGRGYRTRSAIMCCCGRETRYGRQRSTSRKVCRVDVSRCHLSFIGPTKVSITSHKRTQLVDSTNGIPSVWSGARELFDTLSTIVSGLNSNHLLFHRLPCGWGFRRKPGM